MSDPASWIQPEPVPGDASLLPGLRACSADPLWLLTRQLGVGELSGRDRGSAISVRVDATTSQLTRLRAAETGSAPGLRLAASAVPLEALIEAEPEPAPRALPVPPGSWPGSAAPRPVAAAQYGMHYLRLVAAADLPDYADYRTRLLATYPLPAVPGTAGPPPATADTPVLRLFTGRAPDAQTLYEDIVGLRAKPPTVAASHPLPAGGVDAIAAAGRDWLDFYDQVAGCPAGVTTANEPTWMPERLEYRASVAAPGPDAETILSAAEHTAGTLDWYQFDLAASSRHTAGPNLTLGATLADLPPTTTTTYALPTPVRYAGMPSSRFWEFEDAAINFGDINEPAEGLLSTLIVHYALCYGNDHYLIPFPLPLGSVCRVSRLVVTTTYGERILIRPVAELEPSGPFRLFEHTLPPPGQPGDQPRDPMFVLFPAVEQGLTSSAIESVSYLRDELAEIVWAIERTALGPAGLPTDRSTSTSPPPAPPNADAQVRDYLLRTAVEANWFPYLLADPITRPNPSTMTLAEMRSVDGSAPPRPWGDLLLNAPALQQEEVTQAGVQAARIWRYTRWTDGSHYCWVGRSIRPGRGEGSSGLQYDIAAATAATPSTQDPS